MNPTDRSTTNRDDAPLAGAADQLPSSNTDANRAPRVDIDGNRRLRDWLNGHGEGDAFCALADALDHIADLIPHQCDDHGRDAIQEDEDWREFCSECAAEGWSGELSAISGDTIASAVIAEIKRRLLP